MSTKISILDVARALGRRDGHLCADRQQTHGTLKVGVRDRRDVQEEQAHRAASCRALAFQLGAGPDEAGEAAEAYGHAFRTVLGERVAMRLDTVH